ncbi:zinc finger protein 771-like [Corythoichthys intestinalis]|uniref:zinc finger protein 771-like n=1 Tax=Corythoichthys intestinalis TaxID=161448 RepID=UPI0025A67DF7|nr:zinc finger protein 771-like [Corythoichthys intestinalis]
MAYIKEEAQPETPYMKEEEQEYEIITFPLTVSVKSEEDKGPSQEKKSNKTHKNPLYGETIFLSGLRKKTFCFRFTSRLHATLAYSRQACSTFENPSSDPKRSLQVFSSDKHRNVTEKNLPSEKHNPTHVTQEKESGMSYIKEEAQQKTNYMKEEEQKDEITTFPLPVSVKTEENRSPSQESSGEKLASSSSFQHLTTKDITEDDLPLEKHKPTHVTREESEQYIKEEAQPETNYMEEEQKDEITPFPLTVSVKTEEEEGQSKESRGAKPASGNSFQDLTINGEGCSQPDSLIAPLSDSDNVTSHSTETNTDEEDVDFDPKSSKSSKKSLLEKDTKECTGGKPFACSLCDKRFCLKKHLTRHTNTHTREKRYVCTCCGKRFAEKGELNNHTRIHTGEKPFACSLCDKRFCWKQQLTIHARTHTGEKPFACSICDKKFSQKGHLTSHTRTH